MQPVKVDFYLLKEDSAASLWQIACRLLEKAYHHQLQTFVWCNTLADAQQLDTLLWTFKEESFIPHALNTETLPQRPPIEIGVNAKEPTPLVLNLTPQIPEIAETLQRIIEIVPPDEAGKAICREHYRAYKTMGFHLNTHPL